MNKRELVSTLSSNLQISDADAQRFIESFQGIVADALSNGEEISLIGFGRFHIKKQRARIGRNPATGESIKIPAKVLPAFSPGKTLKATVNSAA